MDASDAAMSGFRILHRYLGMKNLADYLAARHTLLGAAYLDIATVVDVGAN